MTSAEGHTSLVSFLPAVGQPSPPIDRRIPTKGHSSPMSSPLAVRQPGSIPDGQASGVLGVSAVLGTGEDQQDSNQSTNSAIFFSDSFKDTDGNSVLSSFPGSPLTSVESSSGSMTKASFAHKYRYQDGHLQADAQTTEQISGLRTPLTEPEYVYVVTFETTLNIHDPPMDIVNVYHTLLDAKVGAWNWLDEVREHHRMYHQDFELFEWDESHAGNGFWVSILTSPYTAHSIILRIKKHLVQGRRATDTEAIRDSSGEAGPSRRGQMKPETTRRRGWQSEKHCGPRKPAISKGNQPEISLQTPSTNAETPDKGKGKQFVTSEPSDPRPAEASEPIASRDGTARPADAHLTNPLPSQPCGSSGGENKRKRSDDDEGGEGERGALEHKDGWFPAQRGYTGLNGVKWRVKSEKRERKKAKIG